jgi:hypothetical protein
VVFSGLVFLELYSHRSLLLAQAPQQIARGSESNQSQHHGDADHQMRIHLFLFGQSDLLTAGRRRPVHGLQVIKSSGTEA